MNRGNSPKRTKKKRNNEFIPMSQKRPMRPEIVERYKDENEIEGTSEKARYRIAKLKYDEELAAWNSQRNYVNKIEDREIEPRKTMKKYQKENFLKPPTRKAPNKLEENPDTWADKLNLVDNLQNQETKIRPLSEQVNRKSKNNSQSYRSKEDGDTINEHNNICILLDRTRFS